MAPVAVGVSILLIAGIGLGVWRPWQQNDTTSQGTPTPSAETGASPFPSSAAQSPLPPPPPPTFSASSIESVLLSPQQINDELGTYAAGSTAMMALDDSSYGMTDNSALVTPPACVGVIFGAEHRVYADTGFEEMRDQTFRPETYVVDDVIQPPYVVAQTVVVYPTAQQAQAALTASQNQWNSCAKDAVTERLPPEDSRDWVLGAVQRSGDLVTVPIAANSHSGPAACQRALGARDNVVVGARRCDYWEGSATTAFYGQRMAHESHWASDDAGRLAQLMLDRVVI